jgi:hypothetical protein
MIGSPLHFVRSAARVKTITNREVRQSRAPCFLIFLLKCIGSFAMCAFGSKPLALIGDALIIGQSFSKHRCVQKYSSFCAVSGVVL